MTTDEPVVGKLAPLVRSHKLVYKLKYGTWIRTTYLKTLGDLLDLAAVLLNDKQLKGLVGSSA